MDKRQRLSCRPQSVATHGHRRGNIKSEFVYVLDLVINETLEFYNSERNKIYTQNGFLIDTWLINGYPHTVPKNKW